MARKDYYDILGVDRRATEDEIKKAFRRLAHKYHPDKCPGDKSAEERFKEINEAYEVLKDPGKRAQYDRFGPEGVGVGFREAPDFGFTMDFQDIFGDVFGDFFGTRARRTRGQRGADLRYDLDISFEEAAFGTEKKVKIPKTTRCPSCQGSGARPGTAPVTCPTCGGRGQVRYQQGFFSISRPCSQCKGEGMIIKEPCSECAGSGRVRTTQTLTVKVPAGVEIGTRLRLSGEGESGLQGGSPGDLYINITIRPHPIFQRQNDNILCEVPISITQATLGAEIEVPTLDGKVRIKIPPGTQSGKVFRLRGKGIPSLHTGRRGDQNVVVKVEIPTRLTLRQRELLEEFARISDEGTNPMGKGFFEKVKEMFG